MVLGIKARALHTLDKTILDFFLMHIHKFTSIFIKIGSYYTLYNTQLLLILGKHFPTSLNTLSPTVFLPDGLISILDLINAVSIHGG
jgi:hypothetical protein